MNNTDTTHKKFIYSFIPQHIPNGVVLDFLDVLRKFSHIFMSRKKIESNFRHNQAKLTKSNEYVAEGEYIENQAQWRNVAFGAGKKSDMAYSGCEIIAVYNALLALKATMSKNTMPQLISYFEKKGSVLLGSFGTSPKALYRYFSDNNYAVEMCDKSDPGMINALGGKYTVFIVSFYNDKYNIKNMIHTVCITKNELGQYTAHNAYTTDKNGKFTHTANYDTLVEMTDNLGISPKVICIIGIK